MRGAEKFISLVLYTPMSAADSHTLTQTFTYLCTHAQAGEIESGKLLKALRMMESNNSYKCVSVSFKGKILKSNVPNGFIETTELFKSHYSKFEFSISAGRYTPAVTRGLSQPVLVRVRAAVNSQVHRTDGAQDSHLWC